MIRTLLFTFVLTLFLIGTCFALDKDLVAYWTFDEGAGETAKDMTGNGHDGEFVGDPEWVEGKFGKALGFDGSSNYVKVEDDPELAIKLNATYCLWFKPSVAINAANNNYRMLSKNNDYFFLFNYEQLGQLGFLVKDPGGTNHVVHSNTDEWNEGEWYHATGTFDGKEIKIYINGEFENTMTYSGEAGTSGMALWVGADDLPNYYAGAIDDLRIYKRVLTDAEIKQAMNIPALAVQTTTVSAITWGEIKAQ